jgi:DNA-binding MarR family transcriptional regulator
MTKLTDTQLVVLSAASNRADGSILPLPANLKGGAAANVVDGLIRRGLAERIASDRLAVPNLVRITRAGLEAIGVEPEDGEPPLAGDGPAEATIEAVPEVPAPDVGAEQGQVVLETVRREPGTVTAVEPPAEPALVMPEPPAKAKRSGPREGTKQALLIEMLRRPEGATVEQIIHETGWQPHTVRGAIAGAIKKKLGLTVTSEKVDDRGRVYRIPGAA